MFLLQPLPIKHSRTKKHPLANAIKKLEQIGKKQRQKKKICIKISKNICKKTLMKN
jgi:hypothetical protein